MPNINYSALTIPINEKGEPIFNEPWEARAFALALALFGDDPQKWDEFSTRLHSELDEHAATPQDYYKIWLVTLEELLVEKGIVANITL
jgi:nitrile hydratase accessory protein